MTVNFSAARAAIALDRKRDLLRSLQSTLRFGQLATEVVDACLTNNLPLPTVSSAHGDLSLMWRNEGQDRMYVLDPGSGNLLAVRLTGNNAFSEPTVRITAQTASEVVEALLAVLPACPPTPDPATTTQIIVAREVSLEETEV
jgi:hypothetical protein